MEILTRVRNAVDGQRTRGHDSERYVKNGACVQCLRFPSLPTDGLRAAAAAAHQTFYTDGSACIHGHVSKRYVKNGACFECVKPHRPGYGSCTLEGSWATIEALREYHALLVAAEPVVLPPSMMSPGPLTAAHNLALLMRRSQRRRRNYV